MRDLATSQDIIGWHNFMEGCISTDIFATQHAHLSSSLARINALDWMMHLIRKLLHMTHGQWMVKHRLELIQQMNTLSGTQLHMVPKESQFLLEIDMNDLAAGELEGQEYWVCAMEGAVGAQDVT